MALDTEFLDLMKQEVTLFRFDEDDDASRDIYGNEIVGVDGEKWRCRIVRKPRLVRSLDGDEKLSGTQITFFGAPGVGGHDKIVLPDGSTSPIISIASYPDEEGDAYEEVFLA